MSSYPILHMTPAEAIFKLFLFLLVCVTTNAHSGELEERAVVRATASHAYRNGDFGSLQRQHAKYSDFFGQRTSSGAFKMTLFFDGIANVRANMEESQLKEDIDRTLNWVNSNRNTPLAHILHASALQAYGGYFRGRGFSNTVPPQAWKIWDEYTKKAAKYLLDNKLNASQSSTWYAEMLNIARTADWSEDVMRDLFDEGIKKNPADFSLYLGAAEYLLPRWHGNARSIDAFIRYSVSRAPAEYGIELYARLYAGVGQAEFMRRLYSDSLVDWSMMKEGLKLWYERFPTAWNKNILAYHACIAGDKAFAKQLLTEIGDRPEWTIWEPQPQATFVTCTRWANDPEMTPSAPKKRTNEKNKPLRG